MGTVKGSEVELTRDPDCKPKFCKSRPVPNKRVKKIYNNNNKRTEK